MFCTSICSKKEANSNFEVEVKSAYEPSGPSGQSLSRFLQHEATRSISIPPGWDASPSQGYPAILNLLVPIYTLEWKEAL